MRLLFSSIVLIIGRCPSGLITTITANMMYRAMTSRD